MKFILILSLVLTFSIYAQPSNREINYEKPEIRRNSNPLGENFNPRLDLVDAPSSVKREYDQNLKDKRKFRSEIARGFDLDALKQWILHLGKLNLNMITSKNFIEDVASIKGYAKTLEGFIQENYKNILNHVALIDLKLKEIQVIDDEIKNVENLDAHRLEHPYWKERINEIIENSAKTHNNFNIGLFGIKSVILKLETYLNHLQQTYVDPATLDYTLEDSAKKEGEEWEYIPTTSAYIKTAGQWLHANIKPIVTDYLLVDSSGKRNDISSTQAHQIAQEVQNVAVNNLNKKDNVQKIEEIVNDPKNSLQQTNAKVSEIVGDVVEQAIEKVNNKKANNVKVDVAEVAEEVQAKVNEKLDAVTEEESQKQAEEEASKEVTEIKSEEEPAKEGEHSSEVEQKKNNNKKNNNKKNNNKKNNNKKNNNKKNEVKEEAKEGEAKEGEAKEDAQEGEAKEEAEQGEAMEEADQGEAKENNKKNNNKKNNHKKNNNKKNEVKEEAKEGEAKEDAQEGEAKEEAEQGEAREEAEQGEAKEEAQIGEAKEGEKANKNKKKQNKNKKNQKKKYKRFRY